MILGCRANDKIENSDGFLALVVLWYLPRPSARPDPQLIMATVPDPLDPLLDRWRSVLPPAPTPEALSHEVWRRIADAEVTPSEPGVWGRIEAAFSRPSFAFAFVAACTLFGLFLAEIRVSRQQAQRNMQLAQAYIQLIDPLINDATSGPGAPPTRSSP